MRRLVFIAEGDTEEEFVYNLLTPYFNDKGYYDISCFKIKHSNGGVSKYSSIREDIMRVVHEKDVVLTTMLDFYKIPHDTPGFSVTTSDASHLQQVLLMEKAMLDDVAQHFKQAPLHFVPYLQLHEFEAILFSSDRGIIEYFNGTANISLFHKIQKENPNPEDIDSGEATAPSKRMNLVIPDYEKPLYGNSLAMSIGLDIIMDKCPHFRNWIRRLLNALT